jgi:hypothetical protein
MCPSPHHRGQTIECEDDLTVATCLEGIVAPATYVLVIVYLTIDAENLLVVWGDKRLSS